MGTLEHEVRHTGRRVRVQDAVLLGLYGVATISLAVLAPNAVRFLKDFDPDFAKKRKSNYRIQQAVKRLEQRGLISFEIIQGTRRAKLTKKGHAHAAQLHNAQAVVIRKPRHWDSKWRMVIFDVWERRRNARTQLRSMLRKAGFERLQDSVWVHPYACEEFVAFVRSDLRLGRGLLYIIADGIENDRWLKRKFDLP